MTRTRFLSAFFIIMLCLISTGFPREPVDPGALLNGPMDSRVPSPEKVLGFKPGTRMTEHYEMERYLDKLVPASPRVRRITYGESYEHRAMHLLIISSPENLKNLDAIRTAIHRLRDPRNTTQTDAEQLARETPVIVWFNYANDGDESAAFEAAIQTAYLLSASQDPRVLNWLEHAVIILNMTHNPDSHQKFVSWYKATVVGPHGTADPQADEHMGDWRMKSNYNHYLFDLNRDALALTQRESQFVAEQLHAWSPQVFIDHHGETSNMFFPPYAEPVNPYVPESTKNWARRFGEAIGAAFGIKGWSFYTAEIFDLFYAGYWDSYPALNGAVGMTFETDGGGRKGLQWEREDGTIITQWDAVLHHMTASLNTLDTAVEHRYELLLDFYRFFSTATRIGKEKRITAFVLPDPASSGPTRRLIDTLLRHHIELYQLERETSLKVRDFLNGDSTTETFQAGTIVIPANQPQARLLFALFDKNPELSRAFLRQVDEAHAYNHQKGSRVRGLPYGFYDLTSWSLPVLFNVSTWIIEDKLPSNLSPYQQGSDRPETTPSVGSYGFAFTMEDESGRHLLAHLLKDEWKLALVPLPFEYDNRTFPPGTVIARLERQNDDMRRNPESALKILEPLLKHTGSSIYPLDSAYTPTGIDLGSEWVREMKKPRIAVLTGPPIDRKAYGWIWYLFEQELHLPFTALRAERLGRLDLSRYNVIIIPDSRGSGLRKRWGQSGLSRLDAWVKQGGTLVLIGGSTTLAQHSQLNWTSSVSYAEKNNKKETRELPDPGTHPLPGVLLRVNLESKSWLSLGYEKPSIPVLMTTNRLWEPSETGTNVATFSTSPHIGGYLFKDLEPVIPGKVYCIDEPVGRGHVILFADDPGYRLFTWSTIPMFLNAVLLGPSM